MILPKYTGSKSHDNGHQFMILDGGANTLQMPVMPTVTRQVGILADRRICTHYCTAVQVISWSEFHESGLYIIIYIYFANVSDFMRRL